MSSTLDTWGMQRDYVELDGSKFHCGNGRTRLLREKTGIKLVRVRAGEGEWLIEPPGEFYLAGPMRGYPLSNFPAFLTAARVLSARGLLIASPAEKDIEAGFDFTQPVEGQKFDLHAAFRWDFDAVIKTIGTILLPGWERSQGATAERLVAQLCGREVYTLSTDYVLSVAAPMDVKVVWSPIDTVPDVPLSVPLPYPDESRP